MLLGAINSFYETNGYCIGQRNSLQIETDKGLMFYYEKPLVEHSIPFLINFTDKESDYNFLRSLKRCRLKSLMKYKGYSC